MKLATGAAASSDHALLEAWRAGEREAGERLFARYFESITRFFCNKVEPGALADLVQQTFLMCMRGRDRIREAASFRGYLYGIAHNLLRGYYRACSRERGLPSLDEVSAHDLLPSPSAVAVARQEQRLLLAALRRIPVRYQVVLELHYWEGLSASECAAALEVPLGTVKTWILRGRGRLERLIERLAGSPELARSTLDNLERWAEEVRAARP